MSARPHHHEAPPANKGLLALAGVLLAIPVLALTLVGTYARAEPRLLGFPFFIWYQFLWVALCSALTYTAYRIVLKARPHRPMNPEGTEFVERNGTGSTDTSSTDTTSSTDSTDTNGTWNGENR